MGKNELIFSFYLTPLFLSISLRILFERKFYHFATGLVFSNLQAVFIGIFLLIIVIYIIYQMFYIIPVVTFKNANYNLKIIIKNFLKSNFAISLLFLILLQLFLRFYISNSQYFIFFILLLITNYFTQRTFLKNIRCYIFGE